MKVKIDDIIITDEPIVSIEMWASDIYIHKVDGEWVLRKALRTS